ncbi:AAA family ATPase [Duganella sp. CY15W]|uniref:AAA family ATPase n=1 Tax=Duganella sp. CY15W TaxID=2692172 RepID=UPI00136E6177|nr:AAA family ATPase [Duganella sp. CY15W]MYM30046.1 AAA family ATPase [Duganella sp. CY15W]
MIIAIASPGGGAGKTIVANNLALLRARAGRKVMLVDTDPRAASCAWCSELAAAGVLPRFAARAITGRALLDELELLRVRYNDIVIDTEGRDTAESRAALIAARLAVVPVTPEQVDLASQYKLIARLNSARMFNPGLRVLFVLVGGADAPSDEERAAVRAYVARVMSATLASTVIHGAAPADMDALYREVFNH